MQESLFSFQNDIPDEDQELTPEELEKEAQLEKERQLLLENISSSTTNTLRDKVAWVLNHFPETRDSDITLQLKFWETFEGDKYNGRYINPDDLYQLTRLNSITRERARIQNVYKLFVASTEVRQKRGTLSDEEKEKAIEDKPEGIPTLIVYMDESGKTDKQLIVGSLWFLGGGIPILDVHRKLLRFKKDFNFNKEFHFSSMSRNDLQIYIEMIKLFISEASSISFKIASVPTAGIRNKQDALQQMFYQLLFRGVIHENDTGRSLLPRLLQVWKDSEEEGWDRLLIATLDDQLKQAATGHFNNELYIDEIRCVDSESNIFMQIADLFTASANRVLNHPGASYNYKDEFAEFMLEITGVGKTFSQNEFVGDMAAYISL